MDVIMKMKNMDNLSNNEKVINDYLLKNCDLEFDENLTVLSEKMYMSKATFVRYAKKLGFSGWSDFVNDYKKSINFMSRFIDNVDPDFPFTIKDNAITVANKLKKLNEFNKERQIFLLKPLMINEMVEKIKTKNKVHVFAEGYSLNASIDFCHRMSRNDRYISYDNSIGMSYMAKNMGSEDLAIIVSYSGNTLSIIDVVKKLKHNQVDLVLITAEKDSELKKMVKDVIEIPYMEDLYNKIANYCAVDSIRFIFDIIYSIYYQKKYFKYNHERTEFAKQVDKKSIE